MVLGPLPNTVNPPFVQPEAAFDSCYSVERPSKRAFTVASLVLSLQGVIGAQTRKEIETWPSFFATQGEEKAVKPSFYPFFRSEDEHSSWPDF